MRKFCVIGGNNPGTVRKALLDRRNWEEVENPEDYQRIDFYWKPTNFSIREYAKADEVTRSSPLILNHFQDNRNLCTKTGLIRSLRQYYSSNEQAANARYTVWETTPTTFLLTAGFDSVEYAGFVTRFKDISKGLFNKEHLPEKHCHDNLWLVKPANLNQGRGIEIFKNLDKIIAFLAAQPLNSYWVVQKYIEKPLLYNGRKFDIRIWALVTCKNEVFIYKHGYMRTSSDEYSLNNPNNYVHLTNNCLQKHGENYGKHEAGNTLSLDALQKYLDETFPSHGISVEKHLLARMKDFIIDTFLSVKKSLNSKKRKNCFELFGYDFLIDEDFRTWLLEVNTNPYFGYANNFARNLVNKMVDDMLAIVLDPLIPPAKDMKTAENGFELLYCEHGSSYSKGPKNARAGFLENMYPIPSLEPESKLHRQPIASNILETRGSASKLVESELVQKPGAKELEIKANQPVRALPKPARDINILLNFASPSHKIAQNKSQVTEYAGSDDRICVESTENNTTGIAATNSQGTVPKNSLENIHKIVKSMLEGTTIATYEQFLVPISVILSQLVNWELLSDKDIKTACKALKLVAESKINGILAMPSNMTHMIELLYSQDIPIDIQITTINAIHNLLQKHNQMKKVVCDRIIHALINIALSSCDEIKARDYDPALMVQVIGCLCSFAGRYNRRNYIPGETRDNDKLRSFFITQGGLLALYAISKKAVDQEFQKIPKNNCFMDLDMVDWELQRKVCSKLKEGLQKREKDSNAGAPDGSQKQTKALQFLFGSTLGITSPKNSREASVAKENEKTSLFNLKSYPILELIDDISSSVTKQKEWIVKREREEEARREQLQFDQQRVEEERKNAILEKRKKAEEEFLRRIEEKKRQHDEVIRKIHEEAKQMVQQEEEKRKLKYQELLRKRETLRLNQFAEFQRKKQEEEMQRKLEDVLKNVRLKESLKIVEEWQRNKSLKKKKQGDSPVKFTKEKKKEQNHLHSSTILKERLMDTLSPKFDYYAKEKTQGDLPITLNSPVSLFGTPSNGAYPNEKLRLLDTGTLFTKDIPGVELEAKRHSETFKIDGTDLFGYERLHKSQSTNLLLPAIMPRIHTLPQESTNEADLLQKIKEANIQTEEAETSLLFSSAKIILPIKDSDSLARKYLSRHGKNLYLSGLKPRDAAMINVYSTKQVIEALRKNK